MDFEKIFNKINIYLAAPFGDPDSLRRKNAESAASFLRSKGFNVYTPWDYKIPHAWDYPNTEWGLMVFMNDIHAIDEADFMVMLSYGRESTAGTNWEAGYAFGIKKKIIVVEMTDNVMSLMVANGRYATVKGLEGLEQYDWERLPPLRTDTEQK